MEIPEIWLTPYRLRAVRIGLWASLLTIGCLATFLVAGGAREVSRGPFIVVLAISALAIPASAALPWRRLLESGRATWVMNLSALSGVLLMSLLIAFGGSASSDLFLLYALTLPFWTASLPRRSQIALMLLAVAAYLIVLWIEGWPVPLPHLVLRLGLLGTLAWSTRTLSDELRSEIARRHAKQREAERQARLLEIVADAGRRMSDLDSTRVLETVVDSALALGFESGNFVFYDDDLRNYAVVHARGLPEEYVSSIHSADFGMPALVREQRRTVLVDDYVHHPMAVPMLRRRAYRSVIASPIWVDGRLTAALIAGTQQRRELTQEDTEAFELLASFASRAIENAQRFERERQTVERLGELDRLKGEFVSTVSHELRTPLTAILGMGLTLERQWDRMDDALRREFAGRMTANATALDEIVGALLDFSRLDSGKMEVQRRVVRVDQVVRGVVGRNRSLLDAHRVRLDLDEAEAAADPLLLERVVENLIANAVKHTPGGTSVLVSTRIDGREVHVEVADTGPGIPADVLRNLGERFVRGGDPNMPRIPGAGLGIALVKEILELHGSRLRVRSELGRGASFSFQLPLSGEHRSAPRSGSVDAVSRPA